MKLVSWNVNGLRSCLSKGFLDYVAIENPDVICLQEIKCEEHQVDFDLPGYHRYFHSADKKGYSGTAVFTKEEPLSVTYDFGEDEHRHEGRVITAEYPAFYLVCCYTPNSKDGLLRLPYRMQWEDDLRAYLQELDAVKPVIYCGDLNVAHEEIDRSKHLLLMNYNANGGIFENYNSKTGQGDDVHNADGFYHWGALLTYMEFLEKGL